MLNSAVDPSFCRCRCKIAQMCNCSMHLICRTLEIECQTKIGQFSSRLWIYVMRLPQKQTDKKLTFFSISAADLKKDGENNKKADCSILPTSNQPNHLQQIPNMLKTLNGSLSEIFRTPYNVNTFHNRITRCWCVLRADDCDDRFCMAEIILGSFTLRFIRICNFICLTARKRFLVFWFRFRFDSIDIILQVVSIFFSSFEASFWCKTILYYFYCYYLYSDCSFNLFFFPSLWRS